MSQFNSIAPYIGATVEDLLQASGVTQFSGGVGWNQVVNGLIVQGGLTEILSSGADHIIPFSAPYPTQVLGVFLQPVNQQSDPWIVSAGTNLNQFTLRHAGTACAFYWWAIGV